MTCKMPSQPPKIATFPETTGIPLSSGILNPKQKGAVARAARAAPLALGSQIHASMQNFSPGRHVPYDRRSRKAVARLVNKTRRDVMSARVGGIDLDGSEGAMNQLAESLSLVKFLEKHNDPDDPFHMSEHQPVCVGHQFKNGVTFMTVTTCHLLGNMARAVNAGSQTQGHFDGAFNWCKKDFGLIGFGMNSMGAHFNPVSVSIVNSESKDAIQWSDWMHDTARCLGYPSDSMRAARERAPGDYLQSCRSSPTALVARPSPLWLIYRPVALLPIPWFICRPSGLALAPVAQLPSPLWLGSRPCGSTAVAPVAWLSPLWLNGGLSGVLAPVSDQTRPQLRCRRHRRAAGGGPELAGWRVSTGAPCTLFHLGG